MSHKNRTKIERMAGSAFRMILALMLIGVVLTSIPPTSVKADSQSSLYALSLDGTGDYIYMGDRSDLQIAGNMTLEVWATFDSLSDQHNLISQGNTINEDADQNFLYLLYMDDSKYLKFFWEYDTGADETVTSSVAASVNAGEWHHYAVVRNTSTNQVTFFMDGVQLGTTQTYTYDPEGGSAGVFVLGAETEAGGLAPSHFWNGQIDEARVWAGLRTVEEIRKYMYKSLTSGTNLHAAYHMSDGSGTSVTDDTVNVNDGALQGDTAWGTSGAFAGPRNALAFDGTDDYVTMGSPAALRLTGDLTLEVWAKLGVEPSAFHTLISQGTSNTDTSEEDNFLYQLRMDSTKYLELFWEYGSGVDVLIESSEPTPVSAGEWHHYTVTRNTTSNEVKFYVDGAQLGTTQSYTYDPTGGSNGSFSLGAEIGGSSPIYFYWNGTMDEVRVWSSVLSDSDIQENMVRSLDGDEDDLAAYYRFDYGAASGTNTGINILYDLTITGDDGTLTNFALSETSSNWVESRGYNSWIGCKSISWSTASNWSRNSVPDSSDNVGIHLWHPGARQPQLTASSSARELVIAIGATLDGGSQTLDMYGHWNKLGTFTYSVSTVHFRGSHHQNVSGSGSTTFYNLDVDNTAGVALHDDTIVNNELTLNSDLTTHSNRLEMGTGATSSGTGDVVGTVRRTDLDATARPFGNQYVTIAITSGTAPNPMDVTLNKGSAPFTDAVKRMYTLAPTGGGGYTATVRLRYLYGELNGNTEASLQLWRFNTGTNKWEQQTRSAIDTDNKWVEKEGVSMFSYWAISENGPTAVVLSRFETLATNAGVRLEWESANEVGILGYNLYRSLAMDGLYSRLNDDLVRAKGLIGTAYTWVDVNLEPGVTYYYKLEEVGARGARDLEIVSFTAPYPIYLAVVTNH